MRWNRRIAGLQAFGLALTVMSKLMAAPPDSDPDAPESLVSPFRIATRPARGRRPERGTRNRKPSNALLSHFRHGSPPSFGLRPHPVRVFDSIRLRSHGRLCTVISLRRPLRSGGIQ